MKFKMIKRANLCFFVCSPDLAAVKTSFIYHTDLNYMISALYIELDFTDKCFPRSDFVNQADILCSERMPLE